MYAMVWTIYMVLFGATSAYIGGEVRRARSSQRIGMLGSLILTGAAIAILLSLLISRIGSSFLNALSATDPEVSITIAIVGSGRSRLGITTAPASAAARRPGRR